jgi:hypothetical protein
VCVHVFTDHLPLFIIFPNCHSLLYYRPRYQSDIYYISLASTVPVPDSCLMGCKRWSKTSNLARTTGETEWRNRMQSMELTGMTGDRNIMTPLLDLLLKYLQSGFRNLVLAFFLYKRDSNVSNFSSGLVLVLFEISSTFPMSLNNSAA